MSRIPKLLLLAGGATTAIYCVACVPVDEPISEKTTAPVSPDDATIEQLPVPAAEILNGLKKRIDAAIEQVEQRDVQVSNGFWTVSHGILGVGPELTLQNPEAGDRVNAIDFLCNGGKVRGMRFIPTKYGLDVQNGPMFVGQGHTDQFVAEMVQSGLLPNRKFVVFGRDYTFMDFIRHTQSRVRVTTEQELSWAIIAIGQCLGTDVNWTNSFDEELHFEDLVRYELDQNVEEAACGGTHRLFGLSWVYDLHLRNGGQEVGVWKEVADKTAKYQNLARELRNSDGSFSTNFFRGPGNASDMKLRINTTGHTLEWLAVSLTEPQLNERWVRNAANALALMILEIQDSPMEGGTLYHAVHGLRLYSSLHFYCEK
jgi:hypothetical protein